MLRKNWLYKILEMGRFDQCTDNKNLFLFGDFIEKIVKEVCIMKNKKKKIESIIIATALLFASGLSTVGSFINGKAEYLNSATIVIDEEFGNLNILTQTEGSYTADMVHTMIYDRLWRLDEDGQILFDLVASAESTLGGVAMSSLSSALNINHVPGWEVQPPLYGDLSLQNPDNPVRMTYTLREGVQFQNGEALTVNSLINLVDFAKLQPHDTLIYQTWAPLTITMINDYKFFFTIDVENFDLGIMDVMYNLASPQGSIVHIEDGILDSGSYPIGTGAYVLQEVEQNGSSVSFERWENWWNTPIVPTQYVTFKYVSNAETAEEHVRFGNEYNAAIIRDIIYNDAVKMEYWDEEVGGEQRYYSIEGKPFALFFNTNSQESIFGNVAYRQAVSVMLNKDDLREIGGLEDKSNDGWCYLTDADVLTELEDTDWLDMEELMGNLSGIESGSIINVVVYDNEYFSNEASREYYSSLVAGVQEDLNALLQDYGCEVCVMTESEVEASDGEIIGDICLKEIDLHNIKSARDILYGKGNTDIDFYLDIASLALDIGSFMNAHAWAQVTNYRDEAYVTNLGWQKRAVIRNANVSGISFCNGFNPMGDSSTLDFRFIAVTGN